MHERYFDKCIILTYSLDFHQFCKMLFPFYSNIKHVTRHCSPTWRFIWFSLGMLAASAMKCNSQKLAWWNISFCQTFCHIVIFTIWISVYNNKLLKNNLCIVCAFQTEPASISPGWKLILTFPHICIVTKLLWPDNV